MNSFHRIKARQPYENTRFWMDITYPAIGLNDITRLWFSQNGQRILIYYRVPFTSGDGLMEDCGWKRFLVLHWMVMGALLRSRWSPFDPARRIVVKMWHRKAQCPTDDLDEKDCQERRKYHEHSKRRSRQGQHA